MGGGMACRREMDERVKELCEAKGLRFAPTSARRGWCASMTSCRSRGHRHMGRQRPLAQRLRRQLEAEILGEAHRMIPTGAKPRS